MFYWHGQHDSAVILIKTLPYSYQKNHIIIQTNALRYIFKNNVLLQSTPHCYPIRRYRRRIRRNFCHHLQVCVNYATGGLLDVAWESAVVFRMFFLDRALQQQLKKLRVPATLKDKMLSVPGSSSLYWFRILQKQRLKKITWVTHGTEISLVEDI